MARCLTFKFINWIESKNSRRDPLPSYSQYVQNVFTIIFCMHATRLIFFFFFFIKMKTKQKTRNEICTRKLEANHNACIKLELVTASIIHTKINVSTPVCHTFPSMSMMEH